MLTLHVFPPSPRAFKVLVVANHLGLDYETKIVDLAKGEQAAPAHAALNPNQRMPVLEEDGFVLWEANAIQQYLAAKKPASGLWPSEPKAQADISRWQCWDLAHWDAACAVLIFERLVKPMIFKGVTDPVEVAKGEERFHRAAKVLDGHLKGRNYIVGDRVTLADFSVGAAMNVAGPAAYPIGPYAEIKRWHAGLMKLPAWKDSLTGLPVN